ncbi:MAG: addiction module protein [Desulfobacteraceae bacterium]|nr:addiction module protein [Desulfobacteraceae bacterium]
MENTIEIKKLTRKEKLRVMEALWDDLLKDEPGLESPGWHQEELQEAETRFETGAEKSIDWQDVKKELRKRFE